MAADKQEKRGPNTVGLIKGYQDLDTGLVYDDEGNPVLMDDRSEQPVIQTDKIGVFERVVHADGSVSTYQVEAAQPSGEIATPVPLPGELQDQAGTGQTTDVKSSSATTKASIKK